MTPVSLQKHYYTFMVVLVFIFGMFLRLYDFPDRIIFGPEQGMSLSTAAANFDKFTLLGETNWMRTTSQGHILYHGAPYSYFLMCLLFIFDFNVIAVTLVFALLNLMTALIVFLMVLRIFGKRIALFTLFYFLFSSIMVHHSLFIWIVNPTPLLAVTSAYLLYNHIRKQKYPNILVIGILSSLAVGMQNMYLPFSLLIFILSVYFSKNKTKALFLFLCGACLGSLPTIIFDLRHGFYHLYTYFDFFRDTLYGRSPGSLAYYNFLFLFPFLFLGLGILTDRLIHFSKITGVALILLFLVLNAYPQGYELRQTGSMPPGITLARIDQIAEKIAQNDPPSNFNVASFWDFDSRAQAVRFYLQYKYHKTPRSLEEYRDLDALYVIAPSLFDLTSSNVYEIQSYKPFLVIELDSGIEGYGLFRLEKTLN